MDRAGPANDAEHQPVWLIKYLVFLRHRLRAWDSPSSMDALIVGRRCVSAITLNIIPTAAQSRFAAPSKQRGLSRTILGHRLISSKIVTNGSIADGTAFNPRDVNILNRSPRHTFINLKHRVSHSIRFDAQSLITQVHFIFPAHTQEFSLLVSCIHNADQAVNDISEVKAPLSIGSPTVG